ncbi:MAG: hypothetical protein CMJ18_09325 [Phycisphaeraceae bacterium]|nr:hypothetical protein [Phycisphaeraceae bacterium]
MHPGRTRRRAVRHFTAARESGRRLSRLALRAVVIPGALCFALLGVDGGPASAEAPNDDLRRHQVQLYIEDSPAAVDLVDKARELREQDRLADAARTCQQVIDQFPEKLIEVDGRIHQSAAKWMYRWFQEDADLRQAYRLIHEPIAQRRLEQAGRTVDVVAQLESVFDRYRMTPSGVEAALIMATLYLDHGRFAEAAAVLDELADHGAPTASGRYHMLQAAVGLFGDEPARLSVHRRALVDLNEAARRDRLDDWAANLRRPPGAARLVDADPPRRTKLTAPQGKPLWRLELRTAAQPRWLEPIESNDMIFVVAGADVVALDRYSGRERWTYRSDAIVTAGQRATATLPGGVCAVGDRIVALLGHATAPGRNAGQATLLVGLDRMTGRELFKVNPVDLDDALGHAFFHGTPVAFGRRVFVSARRRQQTRFEDAYVMAVDVDTGRMVWRRHLGSAIPVANAQWGQAATRMTLSGGRLFVSDVVGVVLCLDARTGRAVWLHRLDLERTPRASARLLRSGFCSPIKIEAGLVVPGFSAGQVPWLLDPATGALLDRLSDPGFNGATKLLAWRHHVLNLQDDLIRLVDGSNRKILAECDVAQSDHIAIQGAPSISGDRLLWPTGQWLLEVDLTKLKVVGRHRMADAGRVLVLEDQFVVAGSNHLRGYLKWDDAYERLRQRARSSQLDPGPAMALAELAMTAQRHDTAIEAVDMALACLTRRLQQREQNGFAPDAGENGGIARQVFRQLLSFVERPGGVDVDIRTKLFERMAGVTSGPGDDVAYFLALGRFMEQTDRPEQAMEQYQLVLSDPLRAEQQFLRSNGWVQASLEARSRQQRLLRKHPGIYDRYEAMAREHLARLRDDDQIGIDELLAVAAQYPLSGAALEAQVAAANLLEDSGETVRATRLLRASYLMTRDPDHVSRIVGRLAEIYLDAKRPRLARRWLLTIQEDHPGLRPLRQGQPVDARTWLARIEADFPPARSPVIELPLRDPFVVRGHVLVPTAQPPGIATSDGHLLLSKTTLRMCHGPDFEAQWTYEVPLGTELLMQTPRQVMLYAQNQGQLLCLDAMTGRPVWPAVSLSRTLGVLRLEAKARKRVPLWNGQVIQLDQNPNWVLDDQRERAVMRAQFQRRRRPFIAINDEAVAIVDHTGRAAAVDRATGKRKWHHQSAVEHVLSCRMNDDVLVVGGALGPVKNARRKIAVGGLELIDPVTGTLRVPKMQTGQPPVWLGYGDDGTLISVTANQIAGFHPVTGKLRWLRDLAPAVMSGRGFERDDRILIAETTGSWQLFNVDRGTLLRRMTQPSPQREPVFDVAFNGTRWFLASDQQVAGFDIDGRFRWRYTPSGAAPHQVVAQFASDRYLIVLELDPRAAAVNAGQAAGKRRYMYRIRALDAVHGRILDQYELSPLPAALGRIRCALRGGRLMLSTPNLTVVISGSEASRGL